jgi:hypothetical protein
VTLSPATFYDDNGVVRLQGQLDGSQPGAGRVLGPFPFAYNDAGLNDGITFYTPTVGDILLDAWIEITFAWTSGTTPRGDIGSFVNSFGLGIFGSYLLPVNMAVADGNGAGDGLLTGNYGVALVGAQASAIGGLAVAGAALTLNDPLAMQRPVPSRFESALPWKVVVSQDGTIGGTSPGCNAGAANIYLVVARPSLT